MTVESPQGLKANPAEVLWRGRRGGHHGGDVGGFGSRRELEELGLWSLLLQRHHQ